jgi:hypothetical protein
MNYPYFGDFLRTAYSNSDPRLLREVGDLVVHKILQINLEKNNKCIGKYLIFRFFV